jgi:hypothetical protein
MAFNKIDLIFTHILVAMCALKKMLDCFLFLQETKPKLTTIRNVQGVLMF